MRRAPAVRYTLFTLHILFWLAAFVLNLVLSGSILLLFLHAAAGLALVIYCPAAIILSARNSPSTFDHAGGEVAYVVVQMFIWLISGIVGAIVFSVGSWYSEDDPVDYGPYRYYTLGNTYLAVAVLSLVHFALLTGWMAWIVAVVHRQPNLSAAAAFQQPVHRLISETTKTGGYELPGPPAPHVGYGYNAPMALGGQPVDPYATSGYNGREQRERQGLMAPRGMSGEASRPPEVTGDSRWARLPKLEV